MAKELLIAPRVESGMTVRRPIGDMSTQLKMLDPFVAFTDFTATPPSGFPDHPHRAHEQATYVLEGGLVYKDFRGYKAVYNAGDVQWLRTGKAIIHSVLPANNKVNRALELWINYPNREKMGSKIKYLDVASTKIPLTKANGVQIKQLAGEGSTNFTETPIMLLDITVSQGAQTHQKIPKGWSAFVYVLEGQGRFGSLTSTPVSPSSGNNSLIVLDHNQNGLDAANVSNGPLRFVLAAGQPMNEPVAQLITFTMGTKEEIEQAVKDYRGKTNGFEAQKQ